MFDIHNTVAASYPFDVVRNSWSGAQLHLDNRSTHPYRCPVEGWLTGAAAKKMADGILTRHIPFGQRRLKGFRLFR